jgi:ABC-type oligopeptide transport system ATPase subunit
MSLMLEEPREITEEDKNLADEIVDEHPAISKINHPSRTLIIGKSRSGKTTIAVDIVGWLQLQLDYIIIASPTYAKQKTWDPVRKYINKHFLDPIKAMEYLMEYRDDHNDANIGLIMDDVSFDHVVNPGNKGTFPMLCYNAVHENISLIIICHRAANVSVALRDNADNYIQFFISSEKQLKSLAEDFSVSGKTADYLKLIKTTITDPILNGIDKYPFLFISYVEGQHVYYKFEKELIINA